MKKKTSNLIYSIGSNLNDITNIEEILAIAQNSHIIILTICEDGYAIVTRPFRQVKDFDKVSLEPNQSQVVSFVLNDYEDL